jgi:hypothetical protein
MTLAPRDQASPEGERAASQRVSGTQEAEL